MEGLARGSEHGIGQLAVTDFGDPLYLFGRRQPEHPRTDVYEVSTKLKQTLE